MCDLDIVPKVPLCFYSPFHTSSCVSSKVGVVLCFVTQTSDVQDYGRMTESLSSLDLTRIHPKVETRAHRLEITPFTKEWMVEWYDWIPFFILMLHSHSRASAAEKDGWVEYGRMTGFGGIVHTCI